MSIRGYGEWGDPYFYPAIDAKGHFVVEPEDYSAAAVAFNNVKILRNAVTVFESEHGLDGKLFITDARVVMMCENYQSGGIIWVGGLVGALIASAASDAMAKSRTEGTVLAGHIRYEWIEDVAASSEKIVLGLVDEEITITYRGSEHTIWKVVISLKNKKGIAGEAYSEIKRRYTLFKKGSSQDKVPTKEPHQLPAVNATHSSHQVYCTQCGGKIRESDVYCKHCGVKQ